MDDDDTGADGTVPLSRRRYLGVGVVWVARRESVVRRVCVKVGMGRGEAWSEKG